MYNNCDGKYNIPPRFLRNHGKKYRLLPLTYPRPLHIERVSIERLSKSRNHLLIPALLTVEPVELRGERNLAAAATFGSGERSGDNVCFNWTGEEVVADLEGLVASGNGLDGERAKQRSAFKAIDDIELGGSWNAIEVVFVKVNDGSGERVVGANEGSGNGFEAGFMGFGAHEWVRSRGMRRG